MGIIIGVWLIKWGVVNRRDCGFIWYPRNEFQKVGNYAKAYFSLVRIFIEVNIIDGWKVYG